MMIASLNGVIAVFVLGIFIGLILGWFGRGWGDRNARQSQAEFIGEVGES